MKVKKYLILVTVLATSIVLIAGAGAFAILNYFDPLMVNHSKTNAQVPVVDADALKSQAYAALKKSQFEQAKKLFEQAKVIYKKNNNVNAIAEIDGQLYLIDHTQQPIPTPTPTIIKM